ncbi:MAG: hypothetical protein ACLGPL_10920 [Acidobacteriota bacterium]
MLVGIAVMALLLRWFSFPFQSLDMIHSLIPWYNILVEKGAQAFSEAFTNYAPPYTYLLYLASLLKKYSSAVTNIKLISVAFDIYAATITYKIVKLKYPEGFVPLAAFASVLFAPTVLINSSCWGQCDVIYSSLLLTSLYFAMKDRYVLTMLFFSIAFAFKLQAAFFFPFISVLFLKRRLHWAYLAMPAIVYFVMALPCVFLGRKLWDVLLVYFLQSKTFHVLSANAPNLYTFISNDYYKPVVIFGLALTVTVMVLLNLGVMRSTVRPSRESLIAYATLCVALIPFTLPKMHDRYFFPADLFSIGFAFYYPRLWFVPALFQFGSAMTYASFLTGGFSGMVELGAVMNTVAVAALLYGNMAVFFPERVKGAASLSGSASIQG